MKKISVFTITLILNLGLQAHCFDLSQNIFNSPKREIIKTIRLYDKAMNSHDSKKVRAFYDENYKSSDGFDFDELSQMFDKAQSTYKNLKYKTKVTNVTIYDDWALAELADVTKAEVYPGNNKEAKNEKMGELEGKSVYVAYMKKSNEGWKIYADDIIMEETSLKFGMAKRIDMSLAAPIYVNPNQEYDISLKIKKPNDIIALASISNDEITYPAKDYQEKFRKIPEEGGLERIVKANGSNKDEYAIASLGLTKISVNKEMSKARIELLGMAYLMRRVNLNSAVQEKQGK